jgi:hypothetical protein
MPAAMSNSASMRITVALGVEGRAMVADRDWGEYCRLPTGSRMLIADLSRPALFALMSATVKLAERSHR